MMSGILKFDTKLDLINLLLTLFLVYHLPLHAIKDINIFLYKFMMQIYTLRQERTKKKVLYHRKDNRNKFYGNIFYYASQVYNCEAALRVVKYQSELSNWTTLGWLRFNRICLHIVIAWINYLWQLLLSHKITSVMTNKRELKYLNKIYSHFKENETQTCILPTWCFYYEELLSVNTKNTNLIKNAISSILLMNFNYLYSFLLQS